MGTVASDINPISAVAKAVAGMCHDVSKYVINSCESECDCCSLCKVGFHTHEASNSGYSSSSFDEELITCCEE